jgi:hypothetical protein
MSGQRTPIALGLLGSSCLCARHMVTWFINVPALAYGLGSRAVYVGLSRSEAVYESSAADASLIMD